MGCLFIFGLGYVGTAVALAAHAKGWQVMGCSQTGRFNEEVSALFEKADLEKIRIFSFDDVDAITSLLQREVSHVFITIPPVQGQDLVLFQYRSILQEASSLQWLGYVSATGVYGDHQGAWVDETTACLASEDRSQHRLVIEHQWQHFATVLCANVALFRLSSIYGPHRNTLSSLKKGHIRQRVIKDGQVFSRIHLTDIVQILMASIKKNLESGLYNVSDDCPCPPQNVIEEGCRLLKYALPPLVDYEEAEMSPRARSFYRGNRRVSNAKIKQALGIELLYPSYTEGLAALFHQNAF